MIETMTLTFAAALIVIGGLVGLLRGAIEKRPFDATDAVTTIIISAMIALLTGLLVWLLAPGVLR
jgi:hypothetical protein